MDEIHNNKQKEVTQSEDQESEMQLEGKKPTLELIVGPKEAKKGKQSIELFIKKMTHLQLENKGIELVENLSECKMLSHVYLQDNMIYTLVNCPFAGLMNIV